MTTLGTRIRARRESLGISARALSELCDVSSAVVSFLESGKIKVPNALLAVALAKHLGVSVEWLMSGDNPGSSHDSEAMHEPSGAQGLNKPHLAVNTTDCSNTASGADDSRALCTSCGKVA